jgi:hypothetical protein
LIPVNAASAIAPPASPELGGGGGVTVQPELNPEGLGALPNRATRLGDAEQCAPRNARGTQVCVTVEQKDDALVSGVAEESATGGGDGSLISLGLSSLRVPA